MKTLKIQIILIVIFVSLGCFFYFYGNGWKSVGLGLLINSLVAIIVGICQLIKRQKEK